VKHRHTELRARIERAVDRLIGAQGTNKLGAGALVLGDVLVELYTSTDQPAARQRYDTALGGLRAQLIAASPASRGAAKAASAAPGEHATAASGSAQAQGAASSASAQGPLAAASSPLAAAAPVAAWLARWARGAREAAPSGALYDEAATHHGRHCCR
jgi:hypothetical protein